MTHMYFLLAAGRTSFEELTTDGFVSSLSYRVSLLLAQHIRNGRKDHVAHMPARFGDPR